MIVTGQSGSNIKEYIPKRNRNQVNKRLSQIKSIYQTSKKYLILKRVSSY